MSGMYAWILPSRDARERLALEELQHPLVEFREVLVERCV
jgi:hypothetical protein